MGNNNKKTAVTKSYRRFLLPLLFLPKMKAVAQSNLKEFCLP